MLKVVVHTIVSGMQLTETALENAIAFMRCGVITQTLLNTEKLQSVIDRR